MKYNFGGGSEVKKKKKKRRLDVIPPVPAVPPCTVRSATLLGTALQCLCASRVLLPLQLRWWQSDVSAHCRAVHLC